ncbi:hypothetical protein NN6n1_36560 [Shinella zoogloeoides]
MVQMPWLTQKEDAPQSDAEGRPQKRAAPTAEEVISYQVALLRDMHSHAVEVDWFLTHLLEMTLTHAIDLQKGLRQAQKHRGR